MKIMKLGFRMRCKVIIMILISSFIAIGLNAQGLDSAYNPDVKYLVQRAIAKSQQLKIRETMVEKAQLDKKKAYEAYLPKVSAEASYTRLNDDIVFPEQYQQLLMGTQQLLIKEQVAMSMSALPYPDAAKVNFSTPYVADPSNPNAPGTILTGAVQQNMQEIPPIQEKNITKANVNAQMLLFSGLKVPYSVKAAKHQEMAMRLLSESEKMGVINKVLNVYDKLAVIHQSEDVLTQTELMLNEQKRYVEKAYSNGLTIDLNREKINLALQQLEVKKIEVQSNKQLLYARIEELTGLPEDSTRLLNPSLKVWDIAEFNGSSADRPDIKALDEAIIATNYKRKSELTDYMPKIVAVGKRELLKDDLSMLDPEWYVGVAIRWTIFDGLTAQNNVQQAKLDRIILENKKQEAIDLSNINLSRIKFDIEKNLKLIHTAEKQVKIAESITRLSKKQFEQGLISLNEHLYSLNDYEKAQLDYIQAIAQERSSVSEYLAASGKLTIDNLK
jgi:outer membrane protein TolC